MEMTCLYGMRAHRHTHARTHIRMLYLGQEEVFAISLEILGNAEELGVALRGCVASLGLVHLNHLTLIGLGLQKREREKERERERENKERGETRITQCHICDKDLRGNGGKHSWRAGLITLHGNNWVYSITCTYIHTLRESGSSWNWGNSLQYPGRWTSSS